MTTQYSWLRKLLLSLIVTDRRAGGKHQIGFLRFYYIFIVFVYIHLSYCLNVKL